MTNEFNNKLLQNLTTMTEVQAYNKPAFSDVVSIEKENIIEVLNNAFPNGYVQVGELQCKSSDGKYNGFTVVYGNYITQSGQSGYEYRKGYILIFDDNINRVALITKYNTGTDFAPFLILNLDEQGQLYGIDFPVRNGDLRTRFIMLNNISVKLPEQDYKVVLRQSYFIVDEEEEYDRLPTFKYIFKDTNSARYVFGINPDDFMQLYIQVGESNEWTKYKATTYTYQEFAFLPITHPSFIWDDEGNVSYTTYFMGRDASLEFDDWGLYKATNNGTEIEISNELFNIDTLYNNHNVEDFILSAGGVAYTTYRSTMYYTISDSEAYIMIGGTYYKNGDLKARYDVWHIMGNDIENVFTDKQEDADTRTISLFCNLDYINGVLFIKYYWQPTTVGDNNYIVNVFMYDYYGVEADSKQTIAEIEPSQISKFHIFGIRNAFELYTTYWLGLDFDSSKVRLNKTNLVYGRNHLNGTSGMSELSLVPMQMRLYDNEGIIFARTLYNMVVYNNITESTVQVPNTMLNDIQIIGQKLMGYDMTEISDNSESIEKNIYETLYINVFNKINMVNKNNPDNPISNLIGASRISKSIATRLDNVDPYNNSKLNKVRINYKNGTNGITQIISSIITNGISDIKFYLTPISDILNIELLSNDENTVYQTITEVDDYEIGKTYLLSQKCHVE